jgi:hypothetical protein
MERLSGGYSTDTLTATSDLGVPLVSTEYDYETATDGQQHEHYPNLRPQRRLSPSEGHCLLRPRPEPSEPSCRNSQRRHLQHFPPHPRPDPLLGRSHAHRIRDHAVGH